MNGYTMNESVTNGHADKQRPFKVIIVGGGIAGLTLANCLERAKIDYVLLEAYSDIAPQVGSSIGLFPAANRILDQLDVYDKMAEQAVWPKGGVIFADNGKLVSEFDNTDLLVARHGYMMAFLQRMDILRILYERLEDKSKVLVNSRVTKVDHSKKGVVVHVEGGQTHAGDIVVGTDGVHSIVRSEMRRYADEETKSLMVKDKNSLSSEYSLLFGIANPVPGIEGGKFYRMHNKGYSFLIVGGKDDGCYWFLFEKMDKKYFGKDIPRYTKAQAESQGEHYRDRMVTASTTFSQVWEARTEARMVALEEAHNENWSWGRFACVGDSIHKITPNAGMGGNGAMESAAALANGIHKLLHSKTDYSDYSNVVPVLKAYHDGRKDRMSRIGEKANDFTRQEAWFGLKHKLLTLHFIPIANDLLVNAASNDTVGGTKLDFLPAPKRSLGITMPYNTKRGAGKGDSGFRRIVTALPLLVLFYLAKSALEQTLATAVHPFLVGAGSELLADPTGSIVPRSVYTGLVGFDNFVGVFVRCFLPSMAGLDHLGTPNNTGKLGNVLAPHRLQAISFIADLTPVITIWTIESHRRGNYWTPATIPFLFSVLFQIKGIAIIAPIYYFLHYVLLPPSKYHAADNRLVRISYAKTLIPVVAIAFLLPTFCMYYLGFNLHIRQGWNFVWQLFPLWLTILHRIISRCVTDTTETDKAHNITADMPYLRAAYGFAGMVSATTYLYVWELSPVSPRSLFYSGLRDPSAVAGSFVEGIGRFLKYDYVFCFASAAVFVLLSFWDLKRDERLQASWFKILNVMGLVGMICGPGAAMAVMWAWREEVLATL